MEVNQYYSDVVIDGKLVNSRFFDAKVYKDFKKFEVNNYLTYKSNDYYSWINRSLNEYSFSPTELTFDELCNAKEYSLNPQQKFAGRIMNTLVNNNGMLVYHGLGSGKTQTSIVIGEAFVSRNILGKKLDNRPDTHVLIVVPAALVDQYYLEIIGSVENGTIRSASAQILINGQRQYYFDEELRHIITIKYRELEILNEQEKSVNRDQLIIQLQKDLRLLLKEEREKVTRVYEILSHETFLNRIFKYREKEFLPGEYLKLLSVPNGLLIIDEIQNLVSAMGSSYRKLLYAIKFHANRNFRIVLLTGTPIYDKPFEFGLLMNLLRPRIPFPDGHDEFNEIFIDSDTGLMKNKELFKKMCSGYISYFKGGNPEAYPYKKTTIVHSLMGPYQYSKYKEKLLDEVTRDKKDFVSAQSEFIVRMISTESKTDETSTGVFNNSNLFCNIAFPEAKMSVEEASEGTREAYLKAGIREFKSFLSKQKKDNALLPPQTQMENILSLVSGFSSKFAKVAEIIMKSPGPVFVYSNFVYYGVDAMATVMNYLGYTEFPNNSGSLGMYFVWKGKANPEQIIKAKKLFNSSQNKNGSLLRIMFGTQTVMEGVDFKNVRQVHILDPWWNDSRIQQIIARGIRLCSHKDLPPEERVVDVFIHLSTLGSAEKLFELKIRKPEGESKIQSRLILDNPDEKNEKKWVFRESYVKLNKESEGTVRESQKTFLASQIISGTIRKLADPSLTKAFGSHKGLDSISVQQYMYSRALKKLSINREFETNVKEAAIDCTINKNGNLVRLEEYYTPSEYDSYYNLEYVNYQTGESYTRDELPKYFTLDNILENLSNTGSFNFKNVKTGKTVQFNSKLTVLENVKCDQSKYIFENIPRKIVNLTLNKELIPQLMKLKLREIKQYFFEVQTKRIKPHDTDLNKKLDSFLSKDSVVQKEKIIAKFVELGIGDESVWELYSLEELQKEYKRFNFKK